MGGDEAGVRVANLEEWNKNCPCQHGVLGATIALGPAGAGCPLGCIPAWGCVSGQWQARGASCLPPLGVPGEASCRGRAGAVLPAPLPCCPTVPLPFGHVPNWRAQSAVAEPTVSTVAPVQEGPGGLTANMAQAGRAAGVKGWSWQEKWLV